MAFMRMVLKCQELEERATPTTGGVIGRYYPGVSLDQIRSELTDSLPANTAIQKFNPQPFGTSGQHAVGFALLGSGETSLAIGFVEADGTPVSTFGTNGIKFFSDPDTTGFYSEIQSVVPDADGRLVVLGLVYSENQNKEYAFLSRIDANGTPDPTFGNSGVLKIYDFRFHDLALQPDHSIVLLGNPESDLTDLAAIRLMRITPNGNIDHSFGPGGLASLPENFAPLRQHIITVQPDTGRILIAGRVIIDSKPSFKRAVVGLTPTGQPDPNYGTDGIALSNEEPMALDSLGFFQNDDGSVSLAGWNSNNELGISRFLPSGRADDSFGDHGSISIPLTALLFHPETNYPQLEGLVQGTNNSIIFYGAALRRDPKNLGVNFGFAGRIDVNGLLDTTYGSRQVDLEKSWGGLRVISYDRAVDGPDERPVINFTPPAGAFLASGKARQTQLFDSANPSIAAGTVNFFPNIPVTIRTATADVNGDGIPDLIGGEGPGSRPFVFVIDGKSGYRMAELLAFERGFSGGVFVSAADLNGDGKAEVVVTPDRGGGPVVVVYDGAKLAAGLNTKAQIARFFGIDDPNFRGGARPSIGDVNGDGTGDLLVAAGYLGGPRIALFDGTGLTNDGKAPPKLVSDFFAFESTVRNGSFVTLGDVNGDGFADLFFGGGPGSGPRIRAFDGKAVLASPTFHSLDEIPDAQLANFFAGDDSNRGGIRLAIKSVNGLPALVVGSGENEPGRVQIFNATTLLSPSPPPIVPDSTLDAFDGVVLADGVFVG